MKKHILLSLLLVIGLHFNTLQAQKENSFRFVFMTDIHMTYDHNAAAGLKQAIKTAESYKPDFIVTGGDLIMDALDQTYSRADSLYRLYEKLTKKTKLPVYNCMGNHEIWGWARSASVDTTNEEYGKGMFVKRLAPAYYSVDLHGWHFIFLSSIQRDYKGVYFGGIDEKQMEWLRNDLIKTDVKTPVVIVTHIPLMTLQAQYFYGSMASNGPGDVITNAKDVLKLFNKHNLKLVLQGHLHYYEKMEVNNISFITGGAVSASWWSGPYHGTEEGFVVLDIKGNKIKANYHDFGWKAVK
ncbi:MAG: metallophosphoesterase [Bacteroidetes bacterium]|nr:metallophosphoesterase [Bacteroidota bacterium]